MPRTMSLIIPPPTAVTIPRITTPRMSIFFLMAVMAPDRAKATVPIISNTKSIYSMSLISYS